jgi:hypothetical protein
MSRYIESIDIVLLAELLEIKRLVTLIAIKDEQLTCTNYLLLCIGNKVSQLCDTKLICCLSIVAKCDHLVAWYLCFFVPGR